MTTEIELAGSLGSMTNLVHGFIYFAPEATTEYEALGLAPSQHYFASRAAAMGPVSPELVGATFFNFNPSLVRAAIPAAWEVASAPTIQQARMRAAGEVLARCCAEIDARHLADVSSVAAAMGAGIGDEGKALAAGNRAVPEPDEPWARFWQRITLLREWRGDVHVAALTSAPLDGIEALILHAATDQVPRSALVSTRQWPADAWAAAADRLRARGLIDGDERFTDEGRRFREEIERRTDVACVAMVAAVGEAEARRFLELLKPIRRGLLDGGAFARMGR